MKVRSRVRVDGGDGLRKGVRKRRNFAEEGISQETVFRRAIGCGGEEAVRDAKGGRRRRERGCEERMGSSSAALSGGEVQIGSRREGKEEARPFLEGLARVCAAWRGRPACAEL